MFQYATNKCFRTTRFLIITFISEYKNNSNTQRFEVSKNTFIDNESSNKCKVHQEIKMQSIVFVTLRKPNNETEVPLIKK